MAQLESVLQPSSTTSSSSSSSSISRTPYLMSTGTDVNTTQDVGSLFEPQGRRGTSQLATIRSRVQALGTTNQSSTTLPVEAGYSAPAEHPVSMANSTATVLCQLTMEELLQVHVTTPGLSPLNPFSLCPCCSIMVARHTRKATTAPVDHDQEAKVPSSPHSGRDEVAQASGGTAKQGEGFLKLKKDLPIWKEGTRKTCFEFLRELTELLSATEFPRNSWYRVLPLVVEEGFNRTWVHTHIVTAASPPSSWEDACAKFTAHFESADYLDRQWARWHSLRFEHGESVQRFADRFMVLLEELNLHSSDTVVKKHFLKCLPSAIRQKYDDHVLNQELKVDSEDGSHYEPDKVETIVKICVRIDNNMKNRGHGYSSSSSHSYSTKKVDVPAPSSYSSKKCPVHPTGNHSWSECRQNALNATVKKEYTTNTAYKPSSSTHSRENKSVSSPVAKVDEKVKCYNCGQPGHYSNKCPTPSKTNSSPAVKVLQTDTSKLQENKVDGVDLVGTGMVLIKLTDGHHYPTLVDSGSDLSVIDTTLANKLLLPRIPSSGNLKLAVVNVSAKREYRTIPIKFQTIFDCTDNRFNSTTKEFEGGFELLNLPSADYPIIIGKDLIPYLFDDAIPLCFLSLPPKSVSFHKPISVSSSLTLPIVATLNHELPNIQVSFKGQIGDFPIEDRCSTPGEHLVPMEINAQNGDFPIQTRCSTPVEHLGSIEIKENSDFPIQTRCSTGDEHLVSMEDLQMNDENATAVFTESTLEDEYAVHRDKLMKDPEVMAALEENAKITGFCTHPDSVLKLPMKSFTNGVIPKKLCRPQYRIPEKVRPKVREGLQRWCDEGKIMEAPPGTPYNNPIVVVPKRDSAGNVSYEEVRNCLDFRGTNEEMLADQMDQFQLPFIRDTMDKFVGCKIFGEFDLQEAFFQFKLHEDSRPFTAFTFEGKQYMCVGVPFGLSIVPSHFQRVISKILHGLDFTQPYMDNIPFGSKDWDTHKQQALAIIKRLTKYNLKIKPSSVKFGHSHMRCLGHLVSSRGIGIDPKKLSMIPDWPRPTTGKDLMSFLGFVTFIRDHIRHVADLTGPLEAVKNNKTLEWNDTLEQAFVLTKKAVMSAPFLQYPDYSRAFHVATDASNTGVGGVLFQPRDDEEYITPCNIVAICSKKLQSSQTRWSAYKKEYFGIVYCLRQFRPYIWGRNDLVVYTDHKPLTYVLSSPALSTTVHGWFDEISDYNFKIIHRPGILNVLPDSLSRMYSDTYKDADYWGITKSFNFSNITLVDTVGNTIPKDVTGPLQASIPTVSRCSAQDEHLDYMGFPWISCFPTNARCSTGVEYLSSVENETPLLSSLMGEGSDDTSDEKKLPTPISNAKNADLLHELEKKGMTIPLNEDEQRDLVIKEHAMGHFGITAIYRSLLSKNIWWPKMKDTITSIVQNCHDCLSFTVTKTGYNPSSFIHASGPWEHVQVDTSVHLPTSADGHTTLLVIIDVFTGFAILRACTSSTAEEIAKELWDVFCLFGFPKILQSDNGHEFVNDLMRVLVKLSGMEHRFISPYNPRADGKVERAIGTLVSVIKKMVHGSTTAWPMYVPFAQYAFNIKIASLTNSAPFALMFGRSPNEWKDYTKNPPVDIPYDYQDQLSKWKEHQDKMISVLLPAISQKILTSKNQMVSRLNKTRKAIMPKTLPMGTEVYLVDPVKANKWQPKYLGPYTVVRRAHHGGYVLRDSTGDILDRHVTIDQLKVLSSKKKHSADDKDAEVEYVVEAVRDHRGDNPSNYEFLVKWVGYPEADNSWEPISNFRDKEVITKYFKSLSTTASKKN